MKEATYQWMSSLQPEAQRRLQHPRRGIVVSEDIHEYAIKMK
jgi:hypothetical protein